MDKVLLMSLGSRGDMEPFLALGEELKDSGHEVAFCMPAQFENLAKEVSPVFYPMTADFLALMDDPEVKKITGQIGSGWSRIGTILKLMRSTKTIQQQLIKDQRSADETFKPDRIIHHIKCIYPVIAALRMDRKIRMLSPVPCMLHAVDHEPSIGFGKPRGTRWNRWTYSIANYVLINQAILGYANPVVKEWGIKALKKAELKEFLLKKLPVEYAISNTLFPQPEYWPEQASITEFRERNKTQHWKPSSALTDFLENYPEPLYIGFGSMINGRPKEIGHIILKVCGELEIPVVINKSWGGIEIEEPLPSWAFVVDNVPFDWLFKRVRATVHHGGSGTTHSALRFNKRQLIIPHIADQFLWNRLVHEAGIGPLGFPIKELDESKLKKALVKLLS